MKMRGPETRTNQPRPVGLFEKGSSWEGELKLELSDIC